MCPGARARRYLLIIWILIFSPIFSACGASGVEWFPFAISEATPFLPPTLAAPASPFLYSIQDLPTTGVAPTAQGSSTRATPTPACTPGLTFLEDLTIPDGTLVEVGARLDKRWQVENSGTCNWDKGYRLKLITGPEMGVPPEQALYPARSGTQAVIRMVFNGPEEPGIYRSAWQAYDQRGEPFGDVFFIEIVVEAP